MSGCLPLSPEQSAALTVRAHNQEMAVIVEINMFISMASCERF